jgi:GTP-binding protein HflX
VGYTNVGKSTLFNALSSAGVTAEDQLFSTLDPITRRIRLPSGGPLLLTDTVGFIQKLSPTVVAAFRATLEELADSDLLLHVIDITHPKAAEQAQVVEATLQDLDLAEKPRLLVVNKMDLLAPAGADVLSGRRGLSALPGEGMAQLAAEDRLAASDLPELQDHPSVFVSAAKGWNLDGLLREIEAQLMKLEGPLMVVHGPGRG